MALLPIAPLIAFLSAAIVRTDRRLVRDLRTVGAVSASRAVPVGGHPLRRMRLQRLVTAGAIGRAGDDRYYLDQPGWRAYRRRRRIRVLAVAAALLAVVAALYLAR